MKASRILVTALSLILAAVLTACTPGTTEPARTTTVATDGTQATELELTLEELATYNGKDGKPAYVAVDGIIYDISNAAPWNGGEHNGYEAGKDLTDEIKNESPHGVSKLDNVPAVGKLVP